MRITGGRIQNREWFGSPGFTSPIGSAQQFSEENHILQGSAIIRFYVQFHCSADWYFPCFMVLSSTVLYFYSFIDLQFHSPTDLLFKSSTFLHFCSSTILQKILQLYNLFYTKLHSKFSTSTVLHLLPI